MWTKYVTTKQAELCLCKLSMHANTPPFIHRHLGRMEQELSMDAGDLNRNFSVSQRKKVKERIAITHSFDFFFLQTQIRISTQIV